MSISALLSLHDVCIRYIYIARIKYQPNNLQKEPFIWSYGSRGIRVHPGGWYDTNIWHGHRKRTWNLTCWITRKQWETEQAHWEWHKALKSRSLPPVTYFLNLGHTSQVSLNSITSWRPSVEIQTCGDTCHSTPHSMFLQILLISVGVLYCISAKHCFFFLVWFLIGIQSCQIFYYVDQNSIVFISERSSVYLHKMFCIEEYSFILLLWLLLLYTVSPQQHLRKIVLHF